MTPKNYAYKIARPDKDGNTTICKVRGITLNYKNSLTINFDTIKDGFHSPGLEEYTTESVSAYKARGPNCSK
jgi:hypothetical protein